MLFHECGEPLVNLILGQTIDGNFIFPKEEGLVQDVIYKGFDHNFTEGRISTVIVVFCERLELFIMGSYPWSSGVIYWKDRFGPELDVSIQTH